ncbi:uncharacterized protein LY79DRAFT_3133 [Colletotrichum navitas]|uniref:Uncharacterized protein n=1 Tax=Colletotrichum navitas TaxID=681940 RepID=A0AAD8VB62_9PEZI|nr:uncharacterized protein LY79DRAFT_3133 [Colletotrichum navitas]KAK1599989.1 hypothetical protein LY79DRAFT_3133 [Colletotrichum navitas]
MTGRPVDGTPKSRPSTADRPCRIRQLWQVLVAMDVHPVPGAERLRCCQGLKMLPMTVVLSQSTDEGHRILTDTWTISLGCGLTDEQWQPLDEDRCTSPKELSNAAIPDFLRHLLRLDPAGEIPRVSKQAGRTGVRPSGPWRFPMERREAWGSDARKWVSRWLAASAYWLHSTRKRGGIMMIPSL